MTPTAPPVHEEQLVAFRLAGEAYGIPIACVQEVIRACEITAIPRTPTYLRGVVNLRGKIVPVVDLRGRLGLPAAGGTAATRIVVVEVEDGVVGMVVDEVNEVLRLPVDRVEAPSDLVCDVTVDFIRAIGRRDDGLILLLDVARTLQIDA